MCYYELIFIHEAVLRRLILSKKFSKVRSYIEENSICLWLLWIQTNRNLSFQFLFNHMTAFFKIFVLYFIDLCAFLIHSRLLNCIYIACFQMNICHKLNSESLHLLVSIYWSKFQITFIYLINNIIILMTFNQWEIKKTLLWALSQWFSNS